MIATVSRLVPQFAVPLKNLLTVTGNRRNCYTTAVVNESSSASVVGRRLNSMQLSERATEFDWPREEGSNTIGSVDGQCARFKVRVRGTSSRCGDLQCGYRDSLSL